MILSWLPMGFEEALRITADTVSPLGKEQVPLSLAPGRIAAESLLSGIDCPSASTSVKDGYAVMSSDLTAACASAPVRLALLPAVAAAGCGSPLPLHPGCTMRILTGARIPEGADAVLAEEFAEASGDTLLAKNTAEPGRNITAAGTDVARGQCVIEQGLEITPGRAGIMAAAGISEVPVFKRPKIAIIATGDEVVAPGRPLPEGKLYASNLVTLDAFCRKWGMETQLFTSRDDAFAIRVTLEEALDAADALITSGGAWTGDRDLTAKILLDLGWQKAFHRIRIGPGKAVGFGMLGTAPVFILPGGPPSNLIAFLEIALPGLHVLAGRRRIGLPKLPAAVSSELTAQDGNWTRFVFGTLGADDRGMRFDPLGPRTRLQSMADATAVAMVPEGCDKIARGEISRVQVLSV